MIPRPPQLEELPAGTKLRAGLGTATILADFDFETYSEAGFYFDESAQRYLPPPNSKVKGLPTIGVAAYAMHPSTEVISMAYDLKDGRGKRIWKPGEPPPIDLFLHIRNGGLLEAWNSPFEWWVWNFACTRRYGWPELPLHQMRDAAAKARAFALPSSLGNAGEVMNITNKKIEDGKRLINLFSMPRNPTKNNPARRITVADKPVDAALFYAYNLKDIEAEAELSSKIPDLTDNELQFWLCDQAINARGVQLDLPTIKNCIAIVEQAHAKYNQELYQITGGAVRYASEVAKLKAWLKTRNVSVHSLDAENLEILLGLKLDADIHRALRIRELIGSAAVKKLYAMINTVSPRGRLHELFLYHGARTGRAAGRGAQPQNLPNSGIETTRCWICDRHYVGDLICTWCGKYSQGSPVECSPAVVENIVEVINTGSLECVEMFYGNAVDAVSSCLRGMFVSASGKDLICSDYSAIEAVVLAELAGESWRQEVFRTHGCIYEMSASKITGTSFDEYMRYKKDNKKHHPDRKIGKVAELASGYQGWIGAWKNFKADEFLSEEQIKQAILAWRKASPAIVEFWGGQYRGYFPDFYGLEGAAIQSVMQPGVEFSYRAISYITVQDVLYCKLPSGRNITYHRPMLRHSDRRPGTMALSFEGWNSNPMAGRVGWTRMDTYGGKLTENVVQAVARDLLAHAIVNLEREGYSVVLHVHDEIVSEIPEGWGSINQFETIMSSMPAWANGWPVKAKGGWRAKRYAK